MLRHACDEVWETAQDIVTTYFDTIDGAGAGIRQDDPNNSFDEDYNQNYEI